VSKLIDKLISGAQTGADIGGLIWAKDNKLVTGGHMPKGFKTEAGPRPEYAKLYDIKETQDTGYPLRTRMNVMNSDGTLLFGQMDSPGCKLTIKYCHDYRKPLNTIEWPFAGAFNHYRAQKDIRNWIDENNIHTMNVAGNRESTNPGIQDAINEFLIFVFNKEQ